MQTYSKLWRMAHNGCLFLIMEISKIIQKKINNVVFTQLPIFFEQRFYIFLLDKIYNREKSKLKLDKETIPFSNLPIKEKVSLLKSYLPTLLNEQSSNAKYGELYKILSEGIHNLDEKTCDSLFDFLTELILLILEKEQSIKKEEQYLKQLSQTYNAIFNKNPKE